VSLRSFTKYMPRSLVLKLLKSGQDIELGGETRQLTILFSDVESFTSVSERMAPDDLMHHISDYFENLTRIILSQSGTIDKYIGDAIMAFWGAPDEDPDKNTHACRAALLCQARLKVLNETWVREEKPPLVTRIGIHTGDCVVGNMGSSERMNYTLIGDSVNLASRLEGVNKIYGTHIIISEAVYENVKGQFLARPLDIVAVKGKEKGVRIYELVGQYNAEPEIVPTPEQEAFTREFTRGFEFYLKMNWDIALNSFSALKNTNNLYPEIVEMYIDRCKTFRKTPPSDDWDGVYHLKTK
jgi:adenylate cyclase